MKKYHRKPKFGTPEYGHSFEQFILMELKAYQAYRDPELEIRYWRTSTGFEVDFILNEMSVAIEVKVSNKIYPNHLKGLRVLLGEHKVRRSIVVCHEERPRQVDPNIEILPWKNFLEVLWTGNFLI